MRSNVPQVSHVPKDSASRLVILLALREKPATTVYAKKTHALAFPAKLVKSASLGSVSAIPAKISLALRVASVWTAVVAKILANWSVAQVV